ncbi:uncharacterized protein LOC128548974 [Mercenaria mercenaria]|uniref:uncharacterized protein LOC128548974 n=1 Tax=Mercenaria mercenaria TaxID=6596 RepID=UPI00234F90D2|nr:uncharacterized protein LOC128548974 [Mercenaria mercenaria]
MAIFNRLLADCISRWEIHRKKNHERGEERVDIYCGCGIFSLQNAHILYVHFRDNVVQIWIVRCSKKSPSKEICVEVKKHMDDFFEKVFKKCEVERHFKCPTGPSQKDAMYPHDKLKKDSSVYCDYHEYELPSLDLTGCWFSDDRNDGDTTAVIDSGTASSGSSIFSGQPFKKEYDDTLSQSMVSAMSEQMKSVGVLIFCGKPIGTVFRVGSRCVMTALHVIKIVLDHSKSGSHDNTRLESDETFINFNESPCTPPGIAYKLRKEFIFNVDLDVAVLEISNPTNLPQKLKLRKAATWATEVSLIGYGHPGTPNKHLDPKCQIVTPSSKRIQSAQALLQQNSGYYRSELGKMGLDPGLVDTGYKGYDHSSKIVFDCFMEHGGSGAPALTYENQSVEVVGVLTHGLPLIYFSLPENMKCHFPNNLRLEVGAKMQYIFEWIKASVPADIVQDLFD